MVLRPAEIAVIILTFSEYAIQPISHALGLAEMTETDKKLIIKLVSLLALGKRKILLWAFDQVLIFYWRLLNYIWRLDHVYQSYKRKTVRENQ